MSFIRLAPTAPGHKTLFRPVKQKLFRIFLIFKKFHNFFCCTIKSEQTWLEILTKVNNVETNQKKLNLYYFKKFLETSNNFI